MKWLALMALLPAAACSVNENLERLASTEFKPISDSVFEYRALASPVLRSEDSSGAEAERLKWLRAYLDENGYCPNGFEITERRAVQLVTGLLGTSYNIFYGVRCKQ